MKYWIKKWFDGWINPLKKKDSELWFVNNDLHTASTEQTTHQDSVKKSCLRRIFFHKFCLQRIFPKKKYLVREALYFSVLFSLPIYWYYKWFEFKYSAITTTQFVKNSKRVSHFSSGVESASESGLLSMMITHFFDTPYFSSVHNLLLIVLMKKKCPCGVTMTVESKQLWKNKESPFG